MARARVPTVPKRAPKRPTTKRSALLREDHDEAQGDFSIPKQERASRQPIEALNDSQKRYISAIKSFELVFATGPAGTGKTWICGALAAQALSEGVIDKIIITRPAVEAGESLGFLPGEIEDKFDPFLQPFRDVLNERLGKSYVEYLMKMGRIEAAPLAYMRGRTFKRAFVILDEAQNTTPNQMKLFLTRIGAECKVVVNGDTRQKDIHGTSGLEDAIRRVSHIPSVKCVGFSRKDVVRSGLVQEIVEAYEVDTDD
jgi:phosphate starvation-inducible PhoH-like protein